MNKPFALIVEDNRDIAALFRHVIDMAGYRTEIAFNGRAALERLSNIQPDVVILDLSLPEISGSDVLQWIQKDSRFLHTKVIVVTAHAHIANGLPTQPDLVLLKPVSIEQLTDLIARVQLSNKASKAIPMQQMPLDRYTGLYNQTFFMNRLESALKQTEEIDHHLFALFLFKVDPKRKTKKQSYTAYWESVLREITDALKDMLRPTDTLARFDHETFYILIENIPNEDISVMVANRIQERLYRDIPDIGNKIQIPIRIGILLCDSGYESTDQILSDAKYAQVLASAQGDEYSKYYYQFSLKR